MAIARRRCAIALDFRTDMRPDEDADEKRECVSSHSRQYLRSFRDLRPARWKSVRRSWEINLSLRHQLALKRLRDVRPGRGMRPVRRKRSTQRWKINPFLLHRLWLKRRRGMRPRRRRRSSTRRSTNCLRRHVVASSNPKTRGTRNQCLHQQKSSLREGSFSNRRTLHRSAPHCGRRDRKPQVRRQAHRSACRDAPDGEHNQHMRSSRREPLRARATSQVYAPSPRRPHTTNMTVGRTRQPHGNSATIARGAAMLCLSGGTC